MFAASQGTTPPGVFIEDLFSTWLYTGTGTTQTITNGIDLAGKGGLVWMKGRSGATDHALYDTARGATFDLASNLTSAQTTQSTGLTSFLASGFSIGSLAKINTNAATYVSWTFRKQPKFFDVVTYTGDGTPDRLISHNLGNQPGCIIVKATSTTGDWLTYHRSQENKTGHLNTTAAFTVGTNVSGAPDLYIVGANNTTQFYAVSSANTNGVTYVAYLFAHDASGFGTYGADNVISCGSYTGNGSAAGPVVTLGYEPQWLLVKRTDLPTSWVLLDTMRGMVVVGNDPFQRPNDSTAEVTNLNLLEPSATGFILTTTDITLNASGGTYIYIAIRRGPMRTPTSGTSVFGLNAHTGTEANATVTGGQTDDAVLIKNRGAAVGSLLSSRLTGTGYLSTQGTSQEIAAGTTILQANPWDVMDGVKVGTTSTITNASGNTFINYLFRRAPGFFDVVCYTGTGSVLTVNHNLGVAPELMILADRSIGQTKPVYSSALLNTEHLVLNTTAAKSSVQNVWNNTTPTATTFTLNSTRTWVNNAGDNNIAYLFASCPGVSKVGSYTGAGTTQTIECGFAAGARFVLIKRTDSTGNWYVWDTARGIVAGNDPYLLLNSTAAEVTSTDWVDTATSGFELSNAVGNLVNTNGASYIFLAIA